MHSPVHRRQDHHVEGPLGGSTACNKPQREQPWPTEILRPDLPHPRPGSLPIRRDSLLRIALRVERHVNAILNVGEGWRR